MLYSFEKFWLENNGHNSSVRNLHGELPYKFRFLYKKLICGVICRGLSSEQSICKTEPPGNKEDVSQFVD